MKNVIKWFVLLAAESMYDFVAAVWDTNECFVRLWKSAFVTRRVESMPEFITVVRYTKNPYIFVTVRLLDSDPKSSSWECEARFGSSASDDAKVVRVSRWWVPVGNSKNKKDKKENANKYLMCDLLHPLVRLLSEEFCGAEIVVRDLYGKERNLQEFMGKYSLV